MAENLDNVGAIHVSSFVAARAQEMAAMEKLVVSGSKNNGATQGVPLYMRRRAASHNVKRLPRRLRQKALLQQANNPPKSKKRPSRWHRRRPKNLLQEYSRRSRQGATWLETHIWHAKRFHMVSKWGYKLPNYPNDKSFRSSYRSIKEHCLMWDLSYWCCVELLGHQDYLLKCLNQLTSSATGIAFSSPAVLSGSVEGSTIVYKHNEFPSSVIGPVRFLWKPTAYGLANRTLWIWIHPGIHDTLIEQFLAIFQLSVEECRKCQIIPSFVQTKYNEKQPDINIPTVGNDHVTLRILKDKLCRFRISGALAHQTILNVIKPAALPADHQNNSPDQTKLSNSSDQTQQDKFWQEYFSETANKHVHEKQSEAYEDLNKLTSSAYLPPRTVLSLLCRDPRVLIPDKKTQPTHGLADGSVTPVAAKSDTSFWPIVSHSCLWDESVRHHVSTNRLSDQEINRKRQKLPVPGAALELGNEEARVPIILIQQPGYDELTESSTPNVPLPSFASGWDIILPSRWSMAFWIAFVYNGARVGGLKELDLCAFECGEMVFPKNWPDTAVSQEMVAEESKVLQAAHEAKPVAKRINYPKLHIDSPFICPWQSLVTTWTSILGNLRDGSKSNTGDINSMKNPSGGSTNKLMVVRDVRKLQNLHQLCSDFDSNYSFAHNDVLNCNSVISHYKSSFSNKVDMAGWGRETHQLIPVHLQLLHKGTCSDFSQICVPTPSDIQTLRNLGPDYAGPEEPQVKNMENTRTETCRTALGYVCCGGFSLRRGCASGLGFVILAGLVKMLNALPWTGQTLVLVRATNSLQYRFATLEIVNSM